MTTCYYTEPRLGIVIVQKSVPGQTIAWTGISEIDKNIQNSLIVGQKLGQMDQFACSGIANLQNLNIPSIENIFQTIRVRYYGDQIYTECGDQVLIVLNPHKPLNISIYDDQLVQYKLSKQVDKYPHIYKIAEQAKTQIFQSPLKSASLLLTGQSGAGKTYSTKYVLKYIAKESKSGTYQTQASIDQISIDAQITQTNLLFEAFGNAQTAKNKNSSRFGKVVQIQFNNQKKVQSGRIQIHLFEKIRLTKLNYQERNYHIFYYLIAAYQNRNLFLDCEKHLNFESQSCFEFQNLAKRLPDLHLDYKFKILGDQPTTKKDLFNFVALCDSLELLKFKEEEIFAIFEIIAALLHLGGVEKTTVATYNPYKYASQLLQIPNLEELCQRDELKSVGKTIEAVTPNNGFIIHVYSQLFEWIVNRVNSQLSQGFVEQNQYILNVFDGFGFETIENEQGIQQNHLEQMIVNYTCEKLQNYFFDSIVKYEQTPYINEGIQWKKIQFDQNDLLVKLFEEVIFASLSDCTQIGATEQNLLDTIKKACPARRTSVRGAEERNITQLSDLLIRDCHTNLQQSKKILIQSQIERKVLGIKHSNGEVFYNFHQFLQRNKYAISEQRQSITQQSSNNVVSRLPVIKQSTTLVKNTQTSLQQLLQLFQSTVPFFVKCILPNNLHKPRSFDGPSVLKQLIESGVQQTAQLLTELYHFKVPMDEFFTNYSLIFEKAKENDAVQVELAKKLLQESQDYQHIFLTDPPLLQFGTNTVFMQKTVKILLDNQQQKLLTQLSQQIPQFGIIPQAQEAEIAEVEEEEQKQVEQPLTYKELFDKVKEAQAQLSIFQKLYYQEAEKNQTQQESASLSLIEQINGKIEILLQRSEPQSDPSIQY